MRAIGWDHPRCARAMLAASEQWRALTGIEVSWEFRSLDDFNDLPITALAADFDLLVIDHPAVPDAVERQALSCFEELLEPARLGSLLAGAVGPSASSYRFRGLTWALAVDAACHVCAFDPEHLRARPRDWDDVVAFAAAHPGEVALPLTPADAVCALVSIAAASAETLSPDAPAPSRALRVLHELVPFLHEDSWTSAPPALLSAMRDLGIRYVPLTFGYRTLSGRHVRFAPPPAGRDGAAVGVLGGAGVAVSAQSADPRVAAALAAWLCEPEAQASVILDHGGQPAHRAVWDAAPEPFFADTRAALARAHIRPAVVGWHDYQRRIGVELQAGLRARESPERLESRLTEVLAAR